MAVLTGGGNACPWITLLAPVVMGFMAQCVQAGSPGQRPGQARERLPQPGGLRDSLKMSGSLFGGRR
ncbi:MAG: hypothetical protein MUP33_01870 [Polaromonas sp.]|nr:hypothetical protein [Polaromonas sp.]